LFLQKVDEACSRNSGSSLVVNIWSLILRNVVVNFSFHSKSVDVV
jgi:hypothetical protein